jgi:hypothetical protein
MAGYHDALYKKQDTGLRNSKHEALNPKWFDQLTILNQVEGQIQNP